MLVVSDTSPIRALSAIGRLDVLPKLYGSVLIPPAVEAELAVPVKGLPDVSQGPHGFLLRAAPTDVARVSSLAMHLNPGESEAIVLALERAADAILIDERRGRSTAVELGLIPIGTLGVLSEAKSRGLVSALAPLIAQVQSKIGFRIHPRLVERVLRDAGETL